MLIIDWLHKLLENINFSNVVLLLLQQLARGVLEELMQALAIQHSFLTNIPLALSSFCFHFI